MTARNLADIVSLSAARRPAHIAVVDGDQRITYVGLDDQITALAAGLRRRGVSSGDRVAILLGNHISFVVAFFGIIRSGAVAVPLNTSSTPAEIEYVIDQCGARAVVCDSASQDQVRAAQLGSCVKILAGAAQWDALVAEGEPVDLPADTDPDATAVLLFTSGSTGRPKGAMLSHRALLANIEALLALDSPPAVTGEDRVLAVLPLFHVYSLNAVLCLTLAAGATAVLSARFSPARSLEQIERDEVTVVAGAPPMYVAWSAEPDLRDALSRVRLLTSGAAPLPRSIFDQIATIAGQPIWEGYGLTECSPVVTSTLVSGTPHAGSVGKPLPNLEVRVVPEGDVPRVDVPSDEDETGEIWVRGPSVFTGYWPDAVGGANEDGWFATGDMGYFDHSGDLRLVDRRSDLILVSGFNVYPREVENVIAQLSGVREAAVTGVEHPYSGEAVKAFVVLEPGVAVRPEDVVEWCGVRLARYKCPTIVEIVDELPHAVTGKLARSRLRSQ